MKRFSRLLLLVLLPFFCHAEELPMETIRKAATNWIARISIFQPQHTKKIAIKTTRKLIDSKQKNMPFVLVELQPQGYVILTTDTALPPVIAFSSTADAEALSRQSPFFTLLESQGELFNEVLSQPQTRSGNSEAAKYEAQWNELLTSDETRTRGFFDNDLEILVEPFMTCKWGQAYPFNLFSPSSRKGINYQAVSGCVPTALSQILYHYQWPPRGTENKTHTDWTGNQLSTLHADFTRNYEWELMQDSYPTVKTDVTPTPSEEAVGRLLSDMGVLCEVDFEEDGTGAYIDGNLAYRIASCLYFDAPVYSDAYYNGYQTLYKRIREDLEKGIPVYLGNHEHAFVTHGLATLRDTYYCYMNYGWNGVDDGWFRLESVYDRSPVNAAITHLFPKAIPLFRPMDTIQKTTTTLTWDFPKFLTATAFRITAKPAGEKSYTVSDDIPGTVREYTLTGDILGSVNFQISAYVNGAWQSASPALHLELSENPPDTFTSTISDTFIQTLSDTSFTLSVSTNRPIASVTISTTRPDIFPDGCESIRLDGNNAVIDVRPCFGRCGRTLLWLDVTAEDGSSQTHKVQVEINRNTTVPYWCYSLSEAKKIGASPNSLILMVAGETAEADVQELLFSLCEREDIRQLLMDKFVLWFANTSEEFIADNPDNGRDWISFTGNGDQDVSKPVISVISSFMFSHVAAHHEGNITYEELFALLNGDYSSGIPGLDTVLEGTQKAVGSDLVFKTGGSAPWFVTKSKYFSSPSALQSGKIGESQSSILMAEVIGTGTISFVWDVDTSYFNEFVFYIDGEEMDYCTGLYHTWERKSFTISDYGKHTFIWCYVKNYNTYISNDGGWLDDVTWTQEPSHLYSSASALSLQQEAGSTSLDVFANVPWTATSDVEWLTVTPTSGSGDTQLILSFQANETVRTREALITVTDTEELDLSFTCKVMQEPCPPQIAISQTEFQVDSDETTLPLDITANCPWIVQSSADWLVTMPAFGGGDESLEITCRENPWCWPREGVLTAIAAANGQQATVSCTVTQDAALPSLSLESGTLPLDFTEGEASLALTAANANWKATCDADWLTLGQSSGTGPGTISFAFGFNESMEERSCTVTVTLFNDDGEKAQATCIVTQAPGLIQENLYIRPGWNLLALPKSPTEEGLFTLLSLAPFIMDTENSSYIRGTVLKQGTPCWIFSKNMQEVSWTAYRTDEWICPMPTPGKWTLLGFPCESPVPENASTVWEWDGKSFQPHSLTEPLPAGKVVWIYWEKE